jgi:two-component system, cell cycle sensor histidine kinase and response regulator CckA
MLKKIPGAATAHSHQGFSMTRLLSMSIRNQIIFLIIMMTLLPLGIIVFSAIDRQHHDIDKAVTLNASVANQIENDQKILLAGAEQLATTVSILPVVKQRNAAAVSSLLAELVKNNPQVTNIIIVDRTGSLWASAIPTKSALSYADRRYFKNAVASGRVSSGEYTIGKISPVPILSFAYPIKDRSGAVTDVMGVVFSLDRYSQLYKGNNSTPASSILLVDHKGTILYSSVDSRLAGKQDRPDLFTRMTEGPDEGMFEADGNLGVWLIFSYRKLRLKGESTPYMYIRNGLNKNYVLATARKDFMFDAGILLPSMLIMLGMAIWFCKRNILDKIMALLDTTERIAHGDLTARVPDHVAGGELGELGGAFNEMAHRLQLADKAQRESENKYRELVQNANSIILKLDTEGRLTFYNEYAERFFGFSASEVLGRSIVGTIVPETESTGRNLAELIQKIFANPDAYTYSINENICNSGKRVWVSWNNHALIDADGSKAGILSVGQDISEQKKTEITLRQSEEKFSAAFHASPDAITLTRLSDGTYLEVNEGFTDITGYLPEEVIGKNSIELSIWDNPQDQVQLLQDLHESRIAKNKEFRLRRKDGSLRIGQISLRSIEINGEQCLLGITRDVTEREYLQNELIKAQRLESISILAGGIAHNFNNVLTGVIGYISFAKKHLGDSDKVLQILESAENASYRAAGLARQLLTFSQGAIPIRKPVSVDTLIEESVSLFLSGSNVKGTVASASYQTIHADSQQISQAFNNIVLNALQAMPDGGILAVRVDSITLDKGNITSLQPGKYVKIVFEDNGCGIAKDDLIKIYDPYFTTKESGTGLGLSTTHSIISKHGGHIDITSEVGIGTTVTILLPSTAEKPVDDGKLG